MVGVRVGNNDPWTARVMCVNVHLRHFQFHFFVQLFINIYILRIERYGLCRRAALDLRE